MPQIPAPRPYVEFVISSLCTAVNSLFRWLARTLPPLASPITRHALALPLARNRLSPLFLLPNFLFHTLQHLSPALHVLALLYLRHFPPLRRNLPFIHTPDHPPSTRVAPKIAAAPVARRAFPNTRPIRGRNRAAGRKRKARNPRKLIRRDLPLHLRYQPRLLALEPNLRRSSLQWRVFRLR